MKTRLALLVVAVGMATRAESGADPFTPTKLEWFVTEMNACCRIDGGSDPDTPSVLFEGKGPDTMVVTFNVSSQRKMKVVDVVFAGVRKAALTIARSRGWSWLRVEKTVHKLF